MSQPKECSSPTPGSEQACAATNEELCALALAHYEKVTLGQEWNNQIPQAIRAWYAAKAQPSETGLSRVRAYLDGQYTTSTPAADILDGLEKLLKQAAPSAIEPREFTEAEKAMNRDYTLGKCP